MEKLGVDVKLLIAQGINFLIFFFIFKKFLARPFLNFLNDYKNKENEKALLEEEIKRKREEWTKEEEERRKQLKKELEELKGQIKKEIDDERTNILNEAKKQAALIKEKALQEEKMMKMKVESETKRKINELSLLLVEKGLRDVLTNELEKEITARIIKNFKAKEIN